MKLRALFQIFLIISSVFSVSLLAPAVAAQEQKVCCSETKDNERCQYTEQTNCKAGALQAATSCEQTSFCKLGCGFDSDAGRCFKNTPKFSCQARDDCTWTESTSCDIPQCQRGCCVLSNQCSFVTQLQCKRITSQFADLNMTFDEAITDEFTCINQCRSFERGACVQPDGSCIFTTRNACATQATLEANITGPMTGFHPDRLCSNPQLGTECAPQQYTGCLPDQDGVYWFDSCGNQENIYNSDKRASYNDGFILDKEESCNPNTNNLNSETCGNCNFVGGTLCGVAGRTINPTFGDYTCLDLSCNQLTVSDTSPASKTKKKLGESWCAFDGAPGYGRDFIGSRHYRRLCINGQELTEPCKDFREEICIQGVQGQPPLGTQEAFSLAAGDYIEAICRPNRHSTCTEIDNQGDCENIQARDCYWIGERREGEQPQKENKNGKCVPLVSPGLSFWPGESTTQTSPLDPKATCEAGNQECKVLFQKPGLLGSVTEGSFGKTGWECIGNCECLEKDYLKSMNNVCKSLGDCGAWFNIRGDFTESGFVEDSDADLSEADVERYDDLISAVEGKSDYDSKFGAFFEQAAPGLIIIGATAVGTAIVLGQFGTMALGEAFALGATSGTTGFFGAQTLGTQTWGSLAGQAYGTTAATAVGSTVTQGSVMTLSAGTYTFPQAMFNNLPAALQTGASSSIATKELTITVTKEMAGTQVVATEGVVLQKGAAVTQAAATSGWQTFLYVLNVLAWIYTIYTLLDVLLADDKTRTITISCQPWVAPTGGDACEQCNEEGKECSEYRCRSFGQLCKLLNPGTKKEACVNSNPNDATSPMIIADKEALEKGYTLTEVQGQGFTLNEKIEPFTAVSLGIKTNEYAQCKLSLEHSTTFDKMTNFFGEGVYEKEHQMTFGLPSLLAEDEALKLTNGGKYTLYVRCQDGNGNKNDKPYYIKFAIKPGPDFTPPVIETTSIGNGAFVPAGINETALTIYTNEPSTCKWSDLDEEFEKMTHDFTCKNSRLPTTSLYYGLYECATVLRNIQPNKLNPYYFRCKDKEDNVNADSFVYRLQGTVPLLITSVSPEPNTKFFTPDPLLKVVTAKGAQGGDAVCGYSFVDNNINNAIEFLKTNSSVHEQQFEALVPGSYDAFISCVDVAGNLAQDKTSFTVEVDTGGPRITKLLTEGNILKISTNEPSTCEFSTTGSFQFGSGTPMSGENTLDHETTLDSAIYYVVCRDEFENDASYKIFV